VGAWWPSRSSKPVWPRISVRRVRFPSASATCSFVFWIMVLRDLGCVRNVGLVPQSCHSENDLVFAGACYIGVVSGSENRKAWRIDGQVLGEIGYALTPVEVPTIAVRRPRPLAEQAAAA